jgi:hypothetical protein
VPHSYSEANDREWDSHCSARARDGSAAALWHRIDGIASRERLVLVEPHNSGLLMFTMRSADDGKPAG